MADNIIKGQSKYFLYKLIKKLFLGGNIKSKVCLILPPPPKKKNRKGVKTGEGDSDK